MTDDQLIALRAKCFADPTAAAFFSPTGIDDLRAYLNGASGTNVWKTNASVDDIMDAVDWSKYTPTASIAGTDTDPLVSRKVGWCLEAQVKQMNLQLMLQGRSTVNAAKPNVRGGLRDAVIQLPTGALDGNGKPGLTSAGGASGASVLAQCVRSATRAELMLAATANGSDTTGSTTARVPTWEGEVSQTDAARLVMKDNGDVWTPGG